MEVLHINTMNIVRFEMNCGIYLRFDIKQWYKQDMTKWMQVLNISELEQLENEYNTILIDEPSVLGIDE